MVTKKVSMEPSRTGRRFIAALSKVDQMFLSPQIQVPSGTVHGTSRNTNLENQEPTEDRCLTLKYMLSSTGPLRPTRDIPHDDKSSPRGSMLLPQEFFRKLKGSAFIKQTTIPQ